MTNNTGWRPVGRRLLILSEVAVTKTDNGFTIPKSALQRKKAMIQDCVIIAMGAEAFKGFDDCRPKVGDSARTSKYVGDIFTGDDDKEYRLVNDIDVLAIKDKE